MCRNAAERSLKSKVIEKTNIRPCVSVIIPVYKTGEKLLRKCLESVLKQTMKEIEIIIVCDGPEEDYSFCSRYEESDSRITVLRGHKIGPGGARNVGISVARGEYLGFVDSDDYVEINYFEVLFKVAKLNDADMAIASVIKEYPSGYRKYKWKFFGNFIFTSDYDKFITCYQDKNLAPYNKIYKRDFIERNNIRFLEGVFYEDGPFTVRATFLANSLCTVPDTNYHYVKNPTSTVNSRQTERHINDSVNAKRIILAFIRDNDIALPDKAFYYTEQKLRFLGITLYSIKRSIRTKTIYLFGVIPIYKTEW